MKLSFDRPWAEVSGRATHALDWCYAEDHGQGGTAAEMPIQLHHSPSAMFPSPCHPLRCHLGMSHSGIYGCLVNQLREPIQLKNNPPK